jgi:plasmid stability protein
MASMTIRDLDDRLKRRLRIQAARNNRSMEEEARAILRAALSTDSSSAKSLYKSIRARIEPLGGLDLQIAPRDPIRDVEIE